jgi:Protein required for attachment to host cells
MQAMKTKLIIVADLGLLRAYRKVQDLGDREPHLELIEEIRPEAAHQKLSQQLTDQAGRFPKGNGASIVAGDLSAGERLNLESEQERRLIRLLSDKINTLLADRAVTSCFLAAEAPIHKQLLDALSPQSRSKIRQVLASDLSKLEGKELLRHFAKATA